jgi:Replication initiator protein, pSAM2
MTRPGPTLAPAPGTRKAPGTGANAAPGTSTRPPDIFDPPAIDVGASAFIRAKDGWLVTREHDDRAPDLLAATTLHPDAYTAWLDHIWPAAACTRPIRLTGAIHRVNASNGQVLATTPTSALPDGVIYKACGNRRARSCPACAETYRRDAFHLIRIGLTGGKGVPAQVASHPAVFATFTAPSFGPVHTRPIRRHTCANRANCRC